MKTKGKDRPSRTGATEFSSEHGPQEQPNHSLINEAYDTSGQLSQNEVSRDGRKKRKAVRPIANVSAPDISLTEGQSIETGHSSRSYQHNGRDTGDPEMDAIRGKNSTKNDTRTATPVPLQRSFQNKSANATRKNRKPSIISGDIIGNPTESSPGGTTGGPAPNKKQRLDKNSAERIPASSFTEGSVVETSVSHLDSDWDISGPVVDASESIGHPAKSGKQRKRAGPAVMPQRDSNGRFLKSNSSDTSKSKTKQKIKNVSSGGNVLDNETSLLTDAEATSTESAVRPKTVKPPRPGAVSTTNASKTLSITSERNVLSMTVPCGRVGTRIDDDLDLGPATQLPLTVQTDLRRGPGGYYDPTSLLTPSRQLDNSGRFSTCLFDQEDRTSPLLDSASKMSRSFVLQRALSIEELNDDSWLSSSLIDLVFSRFARCYDKVDFLAVDFAVMLSLPSSNRSELLEATDILGRKLQYDSCRPMILLYNAKNIHWILIRIQLKPVPELQLFEPMGQPINVRRGMSYRIVPRDVVRWLDTCYPLPDHSSWLSKSISAITSQQQFTSFDCGVACLLYAEKCGQGQSLQQIDSGTSQQDITRFRKHLQNFVAQLQFTTSKL